MQIRAAAVVALMILGAGLSGCGQGGHASGGAPDPFAGLDGEILKWRTDIIGTDPLCRSQVEGQKCESFEVVCKAQRTITPAEQAAGMTAKVVAALNWNGFDPKLKQAQSGLRAALFSKSGGAWTRREHAPVNPTTCADL